MKQGEPHDNRFMRGLQYFLKRYRRERRAKLSNTPIDTQDAVSWATGGTCYYLNAFGYSVTHYSNVDGPHGTMNLAFDYDSDEAEAAVAGQVHELESAAQLEG